MDIDIVHRVREILTDTTMAEILNDEPQGSNAFRDAVRQQIFALCTRLRVSLIIVDKLMAISNALNVKNAN